VTPSNNLFRKIFDSEEERGVYTDMDWWTKIRLEVLRGETSKREILRREGIHWETLKKILEHSEPPGYRKENSRPKPKIGPFLEQIDQIIKEDKHFPKKQRHTAKRIYERIKLAISHPSSIGHIDIIHLVLATFLGLSIGWVTCQNL
jgi:hypothetical protein